MTTGRTVFTTNGRHRVDTFHCPKCDELTSNRKCREHGRFERYALVRRTQDRTGTVQYHGQARRDTFASLLAEFGGAV